jgi:hypothetical protein
MKIKSIEVTPSQAEVYRVLRKHGALPDHALVPLAQHVAQTHQSSSGIRSRRAELAGKGLVVEHGAIRMPSGRKARVWKAVR